MQRLSGSMMWAMVAMMVSVMSGEGIGQSADTPQQSRTGPVPPLEVLIRDALNGQSLSEDGFAATPPAVPCYFWRHGCGPTALGMIVGYYDGIGYDDLIPGSASSQTSEVNQVIASGGSSGDLYPSGSERHYEDYASPEDNVPNLLTDDCLAQGRTPHADDCLADFMQTSRSSHNNYYGWSWSSDVIPAFVNYVNLKNPDYAPTAVEHRISDQTLSWDVLTGEIDAGRPMMFLVDSDGNGQTDHFVPVIDYRTSPENQYAC